MNHKQFKEKLFQKLIKVKEFTEDDRESFNSDFEEFNPTWEIFLEMINEAVEESQPKTYSEMMKRSYKNKKKK